MLGKVTKALEGKLGKGPQFFFLPLDWKKQRGPAAVWLSWLGLGCRRVRCRGASIALLFDRSTFCTCPGGFSWCKARP